MTLKIGEKVEQKHRLKGSFFYVAGAIDRVPDGGVEWRKYATRELNKLGIIVFNPCDKPINIANEDAENREIRKKWKEEGQYQKIKDKCEIIRQVDLRMVDKADAIIVLIDTTVHLCGSYNELFSANAVKRPVLVWCLQKRAHAPDWLYFTLPPEHIFDSFEDIISYLKYVDTAENPETFGRWVFFDFQKLFQMQKEQFERVED